MSLSVFPNAIDDKNTLYTAKNNCETTLQQSLSYLAKYILVSDASKFPDTGIITINQPGDVEPELIYYGKKTNNTLSSLIRGYSGSRQNVWPVGSIVRNGVMADYHNSVKDAIINIETKLGTQDNPDDSTINSYIKSLEITHLTPKAAFRCYPRSGIPGVSIQFKNFSCGNAVRFFWDFGDGQTSIEETPTHVYTQEGIYTVRLSIVTTEGAQSIATKLNYITIDSKELSPFFYVVNTSGRTYEFVDQTDGDISQRYWIFDDGNSESVIDPDIHSTTYTYTNSGEYSPSLLLVFVDKTVQRVFLDNTITVI